MRTIDEIQADINEAQDALQHAEDDLKMARQDAYDAEAQSRKCEVGLWRLLWELAEAKKASVEP